MNSYKKSILGGVFWTTLEAVINRGFSFIIQLILARILFPEDYGLVGMAVVFISFLEVFNDLGMSAALIQRKEDKLTPEHFDTAFWTGIGWGGVLYLLMGVIGAPLVASFYEESQLKAIIPVMSLSLLLNPINLVHQAQLTRAMDFKKLAFVNNGGNITAGIIALLFAFLGFGVWTLVFYSVARAVITLPLYFRATRWFPSLVWKKDIFKDIFGFGAFTTGTAFFNKLTGSIDFLLVGKLVGATALGYYTFAFTITNLVRDQLVNIVNKVLYPVYAKMQDRKDQMLNLFFKIVSINNFIVYPIIVGIFLFAEFLVPIFFGSKWDNSIPIARVLCIAVLLQMMNNSHTRLFRAAGEVRLEMMLQIIKSVVFFVPLISLGVYLHGLMGAAYGFTLATFLAVSTSFYFMGRIFGMRLKQLFIAIKASFVMAVFCMITTEVLKMYLDWRVCLAYYLITLVAIYWLLGKDQLLMMWNIVKNPKAALNGKAK